MRNLLAEMAVLSGLCIGLGLKPELSAHAEERHNDEHYFVKQLVLAQL